MEFQYLGTITKTHGIQGECFLSDVDFLPSLRSGTTVKLGFSHAFASDYVVESCKSYKQGAIIKFKNVDSIEAAETLQEKGVFVARGVLTNDDLSQFSSSMIDMSVIDAVSGQRLGTVRDVWQTPAHRTLVIDDVTDSEILVPFVPSIVKHVDLIRKRIELTPPEGMFDGEAIVVEEGDEDINENELQGSSHDGGGGVSDQKTKQGADVSHKPNDDEEEGDDTDSMYNNDDNQ